MRHIRACGTCASGACSPESALRFSATVFHPRLATTNLPGGNTFNEPFPEHLTRTPTAPAGCASTHPPRPIDKGPAQPFAGAFLFLECAHMSAQRKARDDDKRLGRFYFSVPNAAPRNPVVAAIARGESNQKAGRHLRTHRAERRAQKVALQKTARSLGREG
ncbi:hypothetical protein [Variovorax paradoxus]|nr:hypothetical protein [Variovorax paradoxus]